MYHWSPLFTTIHKASPLHVCPLETEAEGTTQWPSTLERTERIRAAIEAGTTPSPVCRRGILLTPGCWPCRDSTVAAELQQDPLSCGLLHLAARISSRTCRREKITSHLAVQGNRMTTDALSGFQVDRCFWCKCVLHFYRNLLNHRIFISSPANPASIWIKLLKGN